MSHAHTHKKGTQLTKPRAFIVTKPLFPMRSHRSSTTKHTTNQPHTAATEVPHANQKRVKGIAHICALG